MGYFDIIKIKYNIYIMDFDMKNMTTYLGCIALALFVVYLCTNMLSLNNKIVEGLISKTKETLTPDELLKQAETFKTKLSDDLHIKKYGDTYKKLLIALEDIYHLSMISTIKNIDTKDGEFYASFGAETVKSLETFQKANEALSSIDEFLTHHKPASSSSSSSVW